MRLRTMYRHPLLRPIIYAPVVLLILYVLHFAADLLIPLETTEADRALATAYLEQHNLPTPPETFRRDGCTLWPDRLIGHDFNNACLHHDIAYWAGGSPEHQRYINQTFREEVSTTGFVGPTFGFIMYYGVTWFGNNGVSRVIDSHWGFGWN